MGQFSDIDILDQDRQRLAAVRVRVAERLKECQNIVRVYEAGTRLVYLPVAVSRAKICIAELEPLARMLGIETGIPGA